MKVDGSLKSLLQGVSQQPVRDRLPGQSTEQLNMSADPVSGLTRRAPSDLVATLSSGITVRGIFEFEVSNGRQFIAILSNQQTCQVYDFNGVPQTVSFPSARAAEYIRAPGRLAAAAIENQLVISNNGVIPSMTTGRTKGYTNQGPGSLPQGMVQIRGGQYGRDYKIYINGDLQAWYRPPNGSEAPMIDFTRTEHIAHRLYEALTTGGGDQAGIDGAGSFIRRIGNIRAETGWSIGRYTDVIWLRNNNGSGFFMNCSDDAGNINMKAMTTQVPLTADLPRIAPNRYIARIAKETNPDDDLFLEFRLENGSNVLGAGFGLPGYWQETSGPTTEIEIHRPSMPMILEYNGGSSFTLREGNWRNRIIGTDSNNPMPSFIGVPIQDVTTFQSRLVLLTGSYVCMSRTNRNEDFWMSTASGIVDSDPIDISSTAVQASTMYAAVPHNRDLVVFSNKGQFVVYGRNAITPSNATLTLTTAFEAELSAKPVPSGRNVFFATNYGRFTGIREFFTEGGTDINDTRPITQHVKEYIRGRIRKMAASSNYDMMVCTTDESANRMYVYQYIWNDVDKIQSAWSEWTFQDSIEHMFFSEELLYLVLRRGTELYLQRLSLDVTDEESIGYPVYLDGRFDIPNVRTDFVLPNERLAGQPLRFVQGPGCPNPGMAVPELTRGTSGGRTTIRLKYDMLGGRVIGGTPYMSRYRPTMPLVKDQAGIVQSSGKLRIKHFLASLDRTGDIKGQMLSRYGNSEVVKFQARIIGEAGNAIGRPVLSSDTFVVPFREQSDRADIILYTDSHLPMTILDLEWQGQYTKRGRRIVEGGGS